MNLSCTGERLREKEEMEDEHGWSLGVGEVLCWSPVVTVSCSDCNET